ncbi:non-ribosomal peptide synthetase [Pseudomonas sp. PSKL.D1]|uniref:non-ribosomal peptide synthetase n=1 Tax=Pseudomonas sp. PSKL.D1 TaxID=3029060 RepID=UPI002380DEC6|nr:non-ribosomal peptide synthetase [Pseudomonas sp. PSKL.D1]WDY56394.1 amino acid adenylation domain-containing protein [Pseudomonas sp. PSKL.D1]
MNAEKSLKLARRFIELPVEKRRLFLDGLRAERIDFSQFPIAADVEVDDRHALSYAQQRMWFLWQLDRHSGAYNLPSAVHLSGSLDVPALERAFATLVARHQTLRTVFAEDVDGQVRQVPAGQALQVEQVDLSTLSEEARGARVRQLAEQEALRPFDLANGPLLRVTLLVLGAQEHVLLLTLHHIVADGWSMNVLIDEFVQSYQAFAQGREAELPALPIQYQDYALWQRKWLEAGEQERQLGYWREQLGDEHPLLELATDFPRPAVASQRGERHALVIDEALAEQLRALARQHNVTLFMVLLAAFNVLLYRHSGQTDVRVGVPIANRNRAEVEGLIGFFVNTQVLRTRLQGQQSVASLLADVKQTAAGAQAHQDLPFEQLVEALDLDRSLSHNPLFQVMYNHLPNVADVEVMTVAQGLELRPLEWSSRSTPFDLTLTTFERGGKLHASLTYACELFESATIARMAEHWQQLLRGMVGDGNQLLDQLPMLDEQQAGQLLEQANGRLASAAPTALEQFEAQVGRVPEAQALVFDGHSLTYRELDARANALAHQLVELGVGAEVCVGLAAQRSLEMVIGLLAVWKAGAAYVPLDPAFPASRLAYMIEDSRIGVLLTQQALQASLPQVPGVTTLLLDPARPEHSAQGPQRKVDGRHLAYVIYTSGSTGTAKGVAVSHASLGNYLQGIAQTLPLDGAGSMAVVSTLAADLGHTVLFGALCTGRVLHVIAQDVALDPLRFGDYMQNHGIDVLKIVPSHLEALLGAEHPERVLPERCLVVGGEACSQALVERVRALGRCDIVNHYGPTETTVGVLTQNLTAAGSPIVLGRPLPNLSTHVLDAGLQLQAPGSHGELYIGGAALARGYHGRAGMTAERFVPDPFGAPGARLYRSGDRVRRLAGGELAFLGRVDRQVKLRGYRIDLEEVLVMLRAAPQVRDAAVLLVGEAGEAQLVAYVVYADADGTAQQGELKAWLATRLPEYMVPSFYLALEAMPLTANGKLDSRALPLPTLERTAHAHVPPVTTQQLALASIWENVLKVPEVGLQDNFFSLGGHSLLAVQIVSRVRRQLGLDLPLRAIFDSANLGELAEALAHCERYRERGAIPALPRSERLPASFAQQRQWMFWTLQPHSTAYHTPLAVRLQGNLDRQALQQAVDALLARHESLRTTFAQQDGLLYQQVQPASSVDLQWTVLPDASQPQLELAVRAEITRLFDLHQGPLMRVKVIERTAEEWVLVLTLHHITSDGWSMSLLVHEFVELYSAFNAGREPALQPLAVQYADYAHWQRQWLEHGEMQRQQDYWVERLGGEQVVLELPTDRPRNAQASDRAGRVDLRLPQDLERQVRELAQGQGVTLFQLFLGTFALLLQRHSGQQDLRIGVPVNNRNSQELEGVVGFFVNTLVMRLCPQPELAVGQWLQAVKEVTLGAQANQDLPFDRLVEVLNPQRALNQNPLFQVMYNHLSTLGATATGTSLPQLQARELLLEGAGAQFELSLETLETPQGIAVALVYAADLFDASTIERLASHWQALLRGMVADASQAIGELPMLDASARQTLQAWNDTAQRYADEYRVHRLIEQQVERSPAATALVFGARQLSYRELNTAANALAHELIARGVGPDVLVGIAAERSLEMVIGLLAILKAGGAYLPLDPEYPEERLAYMIDDSRMALLLQQRGLSLPVPATLPTLLLEAPETELAECANPQVDVAPEHLAYVIYTSGSTGKPKGAGNRHQALANRLHWMQQAYGLGAGDRVLQKTPFSFDVSVWEFFWPLMTGAQLVVAEPGAHRDPARLVELIEQHAVSTLHFVPSMLQVFLQSPDLGGCHSLRRIVCSGEALPLDAQAQVFARLPKAALYNLYGPTEAAIDVTHWTCVEEGSDNVPIGRPIANLQTHVLDAALQPVVPGVAGELYLGGVGLARGYHRRPALTAERFVASPLGDGERLYRTGDLVRYRADGALEYLGRLDHQVKIRGQRIELGEIEARLLEVAGAGETVVVAQRDAQGQHLVGYVADPRQPADLLAWQAQLKAELANRLPAYMVPAQLVWLAAMPLSPNGKLDRKALPAPDMAQAQREFQAPVTALERKVAAIWAQVLHLEQVGMADHFFDLGGHSLLATQVVSRVAQELDLEVPLALMFEHSTLQAFTQALGELQGSRAARIVAIDRNQPLQLSFAQERQWFLWQLEPHSTAYHIPMALRLRGDLDLQALEDSFNLLVERHESLRTTFIQEQAQVRPVIHAQLRLPISVQSAAAEGDEAAGIQAFIQAQTAQTFDLVNGPLLRIGVLRLGARDHVLTLVQHHIVSDGWSMQVMVDEWMQSYASLAGGSLPALPLLPVQYLDYAHWQRDWLAAGERERQLVYWREQLGAEPVVLELPTDHARPALQSYRGARLALTLDVDLATGLQHLAQQHNVTLFMLLLASFQALLQRYSGQDDIRVGVPVANRHRLETERLIGFFVNTQVLRARFDSTLTVEALLEQVRQAALGAQQHQDLPFEQLVEALQPARSLSHNPLFQVMFNHRNALDQQLGEGFQVPQLEVETLSGEHQSAQFDLALDTFETAQGLGATLTYATDLFDASTIERLAGHWQNVLRGMLADPRARVADLMLMDARQQQTLQAWNDTAQRYADEYRVHRLIEQQVERSPAATALVFGARQLSYRELNTAANALAHELIARGVGPDVLVGIAAERSLEMVIGLLAILKAGGAYLPLDPEYPEERLAYMIDDSRMALLLQQRGLSLPVPATLPTLLLEAPETELAECANPQVDVAPEHLAYVIYTSGSTGKPKGAGNRHQALANRLHWMQQAYGLGAGDRVLQKTPFSFDVSVWEFFWPLMTGAQLVVAEPGAHRDPARLVELIEQHAVSTLHFVPSMLQVFLQSPDLGGCHSLRRIVCSGEALPLDAQAQVFARLPKAALYNLYGPTEAAIDVTHWTCVEEGSDNVPIGRPIANLQTHVLDAALQPVVPGVAGELYLGGVGLARGYHRRPALTAERFVASPLGDGERLYRTGDLVRYRADGALEYLGRLDHQVKIRGQRIELGEIEARLLDLDPVREAVVLAQPGAAGPQLVGYVLVTEADLEAQRQVQLRERLKAHLKANLPEYMVPNQWVMLEQWPLSPNGKLDRKALPVPQVAQQHLYVAPQSPVECQLAAIWQDVLKLEKVGLNDHFFELGGHSLLVVSLVSRIQLELGMKATAQLIFQYPTLGELARQLEQGGDGMDDSTLNQLESLLDEMEEV